MLAPWAAVVTMITLRDFGINPPGAKWKGKGNKVGPFPAPGDFLATFVLFAPLSFLADNPKIHEPVELFAWAIVLSIFLGIIDPSTPLSKTSTTTTQGGSSGS